MQANTGIEAIPDKSTKQDPSFSFPIQLIISALDFSPAAAIRDVSTSAPLRKIVPTIHVETS